MTDIEKRVKSYEPIFGVYETVPSHDGEGLFCLGEGSFGKVFALRHIKNVNHFIALKIIPIPKDKNEEKYIRVNSREADEDMVKSVNAYVEKYAKEIDILKSLDDVSTVVKYKDFDIKEHGNRIGKDILISMELLTSLDAILLNDTYRYHIGINDIIHLGIDICDALVNLQKYNIVHRDIKLSNIFVSSKGVFKLGDFGTAKVSMNREISSERGTPTYSAPEILKREKIEAGGIRCDIYSLGIVMYTLMNDAMPPFVTKESNFNEKREALSHRLRGEQLPLPSRAFENMRLSEIIFKACQYDSNARYENAAQMKADLEAICANNKRQFIPPSYEFEEDLLATTIMPVRFKPATNGILSSNKNAPKDIKIISKKIISSIIMAAIFFIIAAVLFGVGNMGWRIISRNNKSPNNAAADAVLIKSETGYSTNDKSDNIPVETTQTPIEEATTAQSSTESSTSPEPSERPSTNSSPISHFEYTVTNNQAIITKYIGEDENVVIPSHVAGVPVTRISDRVFEGYTALLSITIPDTAVSIGDYAFWGCTKLTTITIPSSVTEIGAEPFSWCTSLMAINVDIANTVFYSDNGILFNKAENKLVRYPSAKSGNEYTMPDNITLISARAFHGCENLQTVTIPKSVREIGYNTFEHCAKLTDINVDNENIVYCSDHGVLFNKSKIILIRYPSGKIETEYIVPNGVTEIRNDVFANCINLKTITIPASVTSIGRDTFRGCTNLESLIYPEGKNVRD